MTTDLSGRPSHLGIVHLNNNTAVTSNRPESYNDIENSSQDVSVTRSKHVVNQLTLFTSNPFNEVLSRDGQQVGGRDSIEVQSSHPMHQ